MTQSPDSPVNPPPDESAASAGIEAKLEALPAAPGVYVRRDDVESKIAALGLKVRHGCTYHGVAINVAMDLAPYSDIDRCGYPGLAVTDLRALGVVCSVDEAGEELAPIVAREVVKDR